MDLPKLDVIKTLENSVMTCYKGRSCPSNVTAYVAITNLSSPLGYGWEPKDDIMVPIMTDELPVPLELMKFSVCGCKTATLWDANALNQLMHTDLGKCVSCKNVGTIFDVIAHEDISEDQY